MYRLTTRSEAHDRALVDLLVLLTHKQVQLWAVDARHVGSSWTATIEFTAPSDHIDNIVASVKQRVHVVTAEIVAVSDGSAEPH
jgi:hypothetical protein